MTTTLTTNTVVSLASASAEALVGGKAHGLHRLIELGVPVPRGFVITADATARMAQDTIPADLWSAIVQTWRGLGAAVVIVRSSAVGEDSSDASFAGQLDSVLDVTSEAQLHDAVLRCWRSRESERVRAYERARGRVLRGMAILIQQQVDAALSGVLFTENPDGRGGVLIEYCAGAGEQLVSGRVNPGRVLIEDDGTVREIACPAGLTTRPTTEESARALAREGRRIAQALGGPQDIEWTIDRSGAPWFVQARPITVRARAARRARRILWSNANVNENFPDPISPFLYSVASAGYYHYFRNLGRAFGLSRRRLAAIDEPLRHIIGVHGARMYYNLTSIHTVLRAAPFGDALAGAFNRFTGADRIAPDEGRHIGWREWRITQAFELARIAASVAWQYVAAPRRVAGFERIADEYARETQPSTLGQLTRAQLLDRLRGFMTIRCHRWKNASLADAAAMVCYAALEAALRRALPSQDQDALHNTLLKALPDLPSSRPPIELWKLSRAIRADAVVAHLFASAPADEVVAALRSNPAFATVQRSLDAYLDDWGFRCSSELMLTVPSFQENPAALVAMLRSYAGRDGESPEDRLAQQRTERLAETRRVLRAVRWHWRAPLAILIRWTQRSIQLRERARLKQALLYSRLRRVMLAIGNDLCTAGQLRHRDDVFMLTVDEVDALLSGSAMLPDVRAVIATRKHEHARISATRPPATFTLGEGEYLELPPEGGSDGIGDGGREEDAAQDREALTFKGTSACGGRATGRATVLSDVTEAHCLRAGDILITRQTDPGWAPVFPLIAGLIMERGGMLSHGAIVAREFGIPSIVGVADATRRIRSGAIVCVDGDAGVVRVVSDEAVPSPAADEVPA